MTGDHAPLVDFVAYLKGQGYADSTIKETLRQAKLLTAKFPAGHPRDEDVALSAMVCAMVDRRATARSLSTYRTWTRRYHRFLLSRAEAVRQYDRARPARGTSARATDRNLIRRYHEFLVSRLEVST